MMGVGGAPAHSREVYVFECHPLLGAVGLSASYDGSLVVWDLASGAPLRQLQQLAHEASEVVDGKWAPDGHARIGQSRGLGEATAVHQRLL